MNAERYREIVEQNEIDAQFEEDYNSPEARLERAIYRAELNEEGNDYEHF